MKRFFAPAASPPAEKKPRRVFNPTITIDLSSSTANAVASGVEETSEKKSSPPVPSIASLLSTETPHHVMVLNKAHQDFAKTAPSNQWIDYSGIIAKLRTPLQPTIAVKGILAFDVDGTIITTKSGKKFPVDDEDWKFWHPSVPDVLREKAREGYSIAFISNQGGVGSKKQSPQGFQKKIDAIIHKIGIPIDFICSLEGDAFRKPCTGMWEFLQFARWDAQIQHSRTLAGDYSLTIEKMYIGDAAGRPATGTHAKDFSDTDLKLSINLGVQVST
jgi:DNA 3'-phosphatase